MRRLTMLLATVACGLAPLWVQAQDLFRPTLGPIEYAMRVRAFRDRAGPPATVEDRTPASGLRIISVVPEGQAARAGLVGGDIIVRSEGRPVWLHNEPWRDVERAGTIDVVTSDGQERRVATAPGMLGVLVESQQRKDLWYLHHGRRDGRWDEHVLTALDAKSTDPELARNAWAAALAAGYQADELLDAEAVELSWALGVPEQAIGPFSRLPAAESLQPQRVYPLDCYAWAAAAGDLPALLRVSEAFKDSVGINLPALRLRVAAAEEAAWRPNRAALLQRAEMMSRRSLRDKVAAATEGPWLDRNEWERLSRGQSFVFASRPGHFRNAFFTAGEFIGGFDWSLRFTMQPTGPEHEKWPSTLTVRVYDRDLNLEDADAAWSGEPVVLGLNLRVDEPGRPPMLRAFYDGVADPPNLRLPAVRADGRTELAVRLLRVGKEGVILVDNRPVAHVPLTLKGRRLAFHLHSVGLEVAFREVELDELQSGLAAR